MTAVDEKIEKQNSSRRLTFRQKFWLFGVGLPVLLMIGLLAVTVFLPKPLNPTEEKLLGKWVIVDPPASAGTIIEFRQGELMSSTADVPAIWNADPTSLTITQVENFKLWTRLKLMLGIAEYENRWMIEVLKKDELVITYSPGGAPVKLERIDPR